MYLEYINSTNFYTGQFTLTEHKQLKTILGPKNNILSLAAACMQCWPLMLLAYEYNIEFRQTVVHGNADGLSHFPLTTEHAVANPVDPFVYNVMQMNDLPVKATEVMAATRFDPNLSKVFYCLRHKWPEKIQDSLARFWCSRYELSFEGDCILWRTRVVIPTKLRSRVLYELQHDHTGVVGMNAFNLAKSCVVAGSRQGSGRMCQGLFIVSSQSTIT